MTPERWRAIKQLFTEAIGQDVAVRSAFLAARCGPDGELREAVERLLESHDAGTDFIETSPVAGLAAQVASRGRLTGSERGAYRLGRLVGAGGMGEVYEGWNVETGRHVAIKVLTEGGADAARRLKREARHALELAHPNICEVYDAAEDGAGAFVVMEFLEGRVLADAIPDGGFSASEAIDLALQLADAVAHAHARGIIHRDLKCPNLMLTHEGRLKVLDFGLARQLPRQVGNAVSAASLSEVGVIAGTLSCLAPEVLRGERADARSDVWAFGVVLHELLTGRQPFEGRTPFELASAVLREPAPPLPSVPVSLQRIRDNCLAKDPTNRYQHGGEVLSALRALQAGERVPRHTSRRVPSWRLVAVGAALLTIAVAALWIVAARRQPAASHHTPSIAVLPLQEASGDRDTTYFADGVTGALIDRLGTVSGLRIISRTSTARYGNQTSLASIRQDLQADVAVRGSIERGTDRVRLTVQLVDTATAQAFWENTFERGSNEVLALENDVARAIVEHVGVNVPASQQTALRIARAVDPIVYENYLKGRFYWNKRTDGSLDQAVQFYKAAIERDPTYAPAHAALADCYNQLGTVMVGVASPTDMRPRARSEAIAAIQADESLAEAHATLGYVSHYDWDWGTAEREFQRALEINPNLALAHAWYANYLASRKRLDEAVAQVRRAEELDPFSLVVVTNVGWTLSYARRPDEAIAAYRRALSLDSTYIQARMRLAGELSSSGRADEAVAEGRTLVEMMHRNPSSLTSLAQIYARVGRRTEAVALLNELMDVARTRYVSPTGICQLHFLLNDADKGFEWMEKAFAERTNGMAYLAVDSYLDPFRSDPRYRRMLARIGLTDVP